MYYENPKFYLVQGYVRDPSSNSMSLLTWTMYVQKFSILRRLVHELPWKGADIQDDRTKHSWGILNKSG